MKQSKFAPVCVRCKHYQCTGKFYVGYSPLANKCRFGAHKAINIVTGEESLASLDECEDMRAHDGACGLEGKLWAPKPWYRFW